MRDNQISSGDSTPYPSVRLEKPPLEGDWNVWIAAGWTMTCYACEARLGRLFIPHSGGYIISGSNAHLDPRLVERPSPETRTGHSYRRYGPPIRSFTKGKRARQAPEQRPGLEISGPFWVHCFACNAGQALEPNRIEPLASQGRPLL
jgi:hypothetical protein